ncbi:TPA_asm: phosphoprotein [Mexican black-tailed rattlesnake bornavirus]|uniref:Phosphoprotein n=1 Tax=Mexican black-tailed rattlesnake bornavirus TaxID=2817571 RepID=A0AAD2QFR3_9MONO|nr:phosphoprotein [Mexican black-tailed rattlesnake bornavirus]DAZ85316.1 TPA_asm: phosphoprotein [Mexican black-tailed rattlesnake bornavirus]
MPKKPEILVSPLEEEEIPIQPRKRSRSPIRRKGRLPEDLLTSRVEELSNRMRTEGVTTILDPTGPPTGKEQQSTSALIEELLHELKGEMEGQAIERSELMSTVDGIKVLSESLIGGQENILHKIELSDHAASIKQLGENIKVLDRAIKAQGDILTGLVSKMDLIYARMAIGDPSASMIASAPGPSSLYPSLPSAPKSVGEVDIIF